MVANPARGQLYLENVISLFPLAPVNSVLREAGSAVPSHVSPLILYTQAESGEH